MIIDMVIDMVIDELLSYLFDKQSHPLAQPLADWLVSSRRFSAFVTAFRAKIRKKLRAAQEQENVLDLRLELATAYMLLQERTFSLVYEPQQPGQGRCPDFAVTFTSSLTFMLEVTRLRATPTSTPTSVRPADRLADTICSKLGQLLPQRHNVLLVGVELLELSSNQLNAALVHIQKRVEGNDTQLLQRHRFRDRADFFQHYRRLSEVLVREAQGPPSTAPLVWTNPQARYSLPSKVRTVLYTSQSPRA